MYHKTANSFKGKIYFQVVSEGYGECQLTILKSKGSGPNISMNTFKGSLNYKKLWVKPWIKFSLALWPLIEAIIITNATAIHINSN